MNCLVCRGACCEDLVIPEQGMSGADIEFFEVRSGTALTGGAGFIFPLRCPELSDEGRCSIHSDRPMLCAVYPAGGEACLSTLNRRRTPEQIAQIRGLDVAARAGQGDDG